MSSNLNDPGVTVYNNGHKMTAADTMTRHTGQHLSGAHLPDASQLLPKSATPAYEESHKDSLQKGGKCSESCSGGECCSKGKK